MTDPENDLIGFLEKIIDENRDSFKKQGDFVVRPGIAYDRFDLTAIDGSYDMSLAGLVHHFLYEKGHYEKMLPDNEFEECENIVKNYPENIYGPEDDENIQSNLDELHHVARQTVGKKLKSLGFEISDEFKEILD
jgi:hypothetical protein|tara:strand:+ start:147 stop:551 length:405 start_codon:yes stop_codon:yes gene_type:complete